MAVRSIDSPMARANGDSASRALCGLKRDRAAKLAIRVEAAEDEVGIGHGRPVSATAVTGGPRIGTSAGGSYL